MERTSLQMLRSLMELTANVLIAGFVGVCWRGRLTNGFGVAGFGVVGGTGTSVGGVAARGESGWGTDVAIGGGEAGDGTGVYES